MDSKQNRERMESGKLYLPADEAVMAEQTACMERLWEYNQSRPSEGEKRARMLEELFAHVGKTPISNRPSGPTGAARGSALGTISTPTSTSPWWTTPKSASGTTAWWAPT